MKDHGKRTPTNTSESELIDREHDTSDDPSMDKLMTLEGYVNDLPKEAFVGALVFDAARGDVALLMTDHAYNNEEGLIDLFEEHPIAYNLMMAMVGLRHVFADPMFEGQPMVKHAVDKLIEIAHEYDDQQEPDVQPKGTIH